LNRKTMKTKILSALLLTLIFSLVMVSADLISVSQGPAFSQSINQSYITITGISNSTVSMPSTSLRINDGSNNYLTLILNPSSVNQALSTNSVITVNANVITDPNFNFHIQTYTFPAITISASQNNGTATINDTKTLSFNFKKTFCKSGEVGTNLSISQINIRNNNGDDTEWKPLDTIKITVRVDNNAGDNVRKVYTVLGLIDPDGKDKIGNMNSLADKKISLGTINEGKDKSVTYEFQVPADFKDLSYKLVVKAYSDDAKEQNLCTSSSSDLNQNYYQDISGIREDSEQKQVVVDNIQFSPETAQCGDKIHVSADVYNIGDTDYEDQIKVTLYSKELGINTEQVIREDLNQGDSTPIDFDINVPLAASEKTYSLEFRTYYDYDSSKDTYNIVSDTRFLGSLIVKGNCQSTPTPTTPSIKITAELDSQTPEAVAGKDVIIDAHLQNTGTSQQTLSLSTIGNSEWSTLTSINPQVITLAPGTTKDVTIKLNIDATASGEQEFTIRATDGSSKTTDQKVTLTIPASTSQNALMQHLQANWFIYVIILVNVILIIAIIIVIRRIVGSGSKEYQ
jgi:hypothetical protein